jgi:hypothetical protein
MAGSASDERAREIEPSDVLARAMSPQHAKTKDDRSRLDTMPNDARTELLEGQNAILRLVAAGAALPVVLDRIARLCEELPPRAGRRVKGAPWT